MSPTPFEQELCSYVDRNSERQVGIISDLVRIPSENTPPVGAEAKCQEYVAALLCRHGWDPIVYALGNVPGLLEHELFHNSRNYVGRPNVGARKRGAGGGRSLVISGHVDTVPRGTQPWTRDPFGAAREGNRIFGRGSNDMKGGVGTNLFVIEALSKLGIKLAGDLVFETVVDEEFGGVNGTLAGRLMGFNADAAIISEPTALRICAAQRGGRVAHVTLSAPGGVLTESKFPAGVIEQLTHILSRVPGFAAQRRQGVQVHELYAHHPDPVPVAITKVHTGPWGNREPITVPETCLLELYWQAMPGERKQEVERGFLDWLDAVVDSAPALFATRPRVEFPWRWLPGSAIPRSEPVIGEFAECVGAALGNVPPITGIEGPCDLYVFHEFNIPAILWGARGGNTHAADEYLEIDSAIAAAKALLLFICRWCGVSRD